jgi:penicillin-binding protein 1C
MPISSSKFRKIDRTKKIILLFLSIGIIVRLLPYLAPIRTKDIEQKAVAIEFSDRRGLPLGTVLTGDREHTSVVELDRVSPQFIKAIIAAEDGGFYQHGALDLKALARALVQAIKTGKISSGASTITMQLARMLEPAPRTLPAKFKEVWLSWRLAAGMSKEEILHSYINRLPMGSNIYGVEAASRIYFGIPASDLNLAQASLLAALPNNPTYLNPYEYWQALKKRQKYVLDRLVKDGYISPTVADLTYREEVLLQPRSSGIIAAPHFLFWLYDTLVESEDSKLSYVQTTIDRPLQQFVEAQVKQIISTLAPHNVRQAAALVIDNHTGEILSYVGSTDYFAKELQGSNDGVQALRQPGSTLKPFLYELALEKRLIHPNTILADVPTHYAIPGAKIYSPNDYTETFSGPVRVRIALANSLNIPAVRVLEKVSVPVFLERLHQLGFQHLDRDPEYYGLGLTLGSGEVSLWELARAYFILARQGDIIPLKTIDSETKIQNPKSKIQNYSSWAIIIDMLSDRYARAKAFGVDSVLNLPFSAAVKTGTSSNFRDTWTVGFTTDYTVATWVGNFNGEPMQQVSGVVGAAPLWHRIMLHLHQNYEPKPFSPPAGMVKRPICALSGLKPTPACPSVVQEYFYPQDLPEYEKNLDNFYQVLTPGTAGKPAQYGLNLPPQYDRWLAMQDRSPLSPTTLKILSPQNGDSFLLNPKNPSIQKLEFKLSGIFDRPVEWRLNGQKLPAESSNSYFWQLKPGEWTLEVKSGEKSDRVSFQVQLVQPQIDRRGFSYSKANKL